MPFSDGQEHGGRHRVGHARSAPNGRLKDPHQGGTDLFAAMPTPAAVSSTHPVCRYPPEWASLLNSHLPRPVVFQVIEYCKYHHRAENELLPEDEKNVWDKEFVKVDDETLFNLILAANYLDIKSLLDLTCKTVADEIKGKTPEQIRVRFNIKNDFTPEEEEEVKRENAWCEER